MKTTTTKIKTLKCKALLRITMMLFFMAGFQTMRSQDVGAVDVKSPSTNPMCGAKNQTVAITIVNYDAVDIDFSVDNVTVTVNISNASTQNFSKTLKSGTLAAGASMDVVVTTVADLSAAGTQTFDAHTTLVGDLDITNDAMPTSVDITVNASPVVNLGPDVVQCEGTVSLDAGNAGFDYLWNDGSTDQKLVVSSTGSYGVAVTDPSNLCYTIDSIHVTINTKPVVNLGPDVIACSSATLDAGNAGLNFLWSGGSTTQKITVSSSNSYSVTVTDGACSSTGSINVTINPLPNVTATADFSVCAGNKVKLNGGGASSYVWDNGVTDGVLFTPTSTTYHVTGTDAATGCQNTAETVVTVNPLPNVTATANFSACDGDDVSVSGSGATSYVWDNGVTDGVPFGLSGAGTITLNVIGTDGNGCSNTASTKITVNALPNVTATADFSACDGDVVSVSGSGATSYVWDNGVTDGVPFGLSGAGTLTLNVIGTDGNGCSNTASTTITVNALPNVTATANFAICKGSPATVKGGGAVTYTWDNGVNDGVPFTPTSTKTYIVTGTDGNACSNTASTTVTVNTADTAVTLVGSTFTAHAIASGTTYEWIDCGSNSVIPGETGQSFTALSAGSYALQVTQNGCTDRSACYSIFSTGIAKINKYSVAVYPNPTSGMVTIDLHAIVTGKIVVRDVLGKMIVSQEIQAQQMLVDLSNYANGMFFISVETSSSNQVFKVTKN